MLILRSKNAWNIGEVLLVAVMEGLTVEATLNAAQRMLAGDCFVLDRYGEDFAFEGCAGHNGRNWLVAPTAEETVKLLQCVRQSLARRMLKWRPSAATFGAGWRSLDSWRRAWCLEHLSMNTDANFGIIWQYIQFSRMKFH